MKRIVKWILPIVLITLIIISLVWYMFIYDRSTVQDFLNAQARNCVRDGHFETAAWFYNMSYKLSDQDQNVAIELAEIYKSAGNYTKAESTLTNAISDGGTAELYIALCQTFIEQDKLLDAVNMLDNITDEAVKSDLDKMRPAAPTVDTQPGLYSDYLTLNITADDGVLYVTTDGEYPSIANDPSNGSVTLENGETKIYALSVTESGLVSPISIFNYTIGGVIEEVSLKDHAIDALLREKLMFGADTSISTSDLWSITELTVPEGTSTLEDLSHLIYLEELTIENQNITDMSFLAGMTKLKKLTIRNCNITADSFFMNNLPSMKALTISGCSLSALDEIRNLTTLAALDLSDNAIGDISALENMTSLEMINLSGNAVVSLTPLAEMSRLTALDISGNSLNSIAPISACTRLASLNVSDNNLASLDAVSNLQQLSFIDASYNALTGVDALSGCTALEEVNLSHNAITNLDGLSGFSGIRELDFSYNQVTAVPDLGSGSSLVSITADYNVLTDISALDALSQLNYVYMDYNPDLEDISALYGCSSLIQLNAYGTKVTTEATADLIDANVIVNYDPT